MATTTKTGVRVEFLLALREKKQGSEWTFPKLARSATLVLSFSLAVVFLLFFAEE